MRLTDTKIIKLKPLIRCEEDYYAAICDGADILDEFGYDRSDEVAEEIHSRLCGWGGRLSPLDIRMDLIIHSIHDESALNTLLTAPIPKA